MSEKYSEFMIRYTFIEWIDINFKINGESSKLQGKVQGQIRLQSTHQRWEVRSNQNLQEEITQLWLCDDPAKIYQPETTPTPPEGNWTNLQLHPVRRASQNCSDLRLLSYWRYGIVLWRKGLNLQYPPPSSLHRVLQFHLVWLDGSTFPKESWVFLRWSNVYF